MINFFFPRKKILSREMKETVMMKMMKITVERYDHLLIQSFAISMVA